MRRHDHEVLDVDPPPGMRAAAENLDFRQRQHRFGRLAEQIGVERLAGCCGGRMQHRHRHRDQRIAAEPPLLRGAVELDQRTVDRRLVGGVMPGQRSGDFLVNRGDGMLHIAAA